MTKSQEYDSLVTGRRVLLGGRLRPGWLGLRAGAVARAGSGAPPRVAKRIDVGDDAIGPALVDTHVHGFGGFDASRCGDPKNGEAELRGMARALLRAGVGAFCPTIYPIAPADTLACLRTIGAVRARPQLGEAAIVGAHLEGPFVNPARPGALDRRRILAPDTKILENFLSTGAVSIVTLAPELRGALSLVKACRRAGVVVSMGHTMASFDEAKKACAAGAGSITHLFNAMAPLHHREFTIANFALLEDGFPTELIPDLTHVGSAAVELLLRARGLDGIRLVSDALAAAGTGRSFRAGGARLSVKGGIAYLPGGTIAGSCRGLAASVAGLARRGLLSLEEAWRLASEEPARLVGARGVRGYCRIPK
jgi:N-acetylglucosamine-6-phosphate deacetylase